MIQLKKNFDLGWKSLLVVAVFFITFTSTNVLIASWKDFLNSEQLQNYIHGGKFFVIGDAKLKILLSKTGEERTKGLSDKEKLDEGWGMLFVFPEEAKHGIWMKDMNFNIDIIWLDSKFLVVDFAENVEPKTFPKVFKPKQPAKYVLEVNTGFIQNYGIKIDDQATFLN
jgi:uncharacterized membrane protein (UPF0127 family)